MSAPLADLATLWARDSTLEASTKQQYGYALAHLTREGIVTVRDFNAASVKRVLMKRRTELGRCASTLNKELAGLLTFARWLRTQGLMSRAAIDDIRDCAYRKEATPPPRWLSVDEFKRLHEAAKAIHPLFGFAVYCAVHTGMRSGSELRVARGEAFSLDGDAPFYTVGRKTKTKRGRIIPLPPIFVEELIRLGFPRPGPVFPAVGNRGRSPFLHHKSLERWMAQARKAAGFADDVDFTALRHTNATWRIFYAGESIGAVARALGNLPTVCERNYFGLLKPGDPLIGKGFPEIFAGVARGALPLPDVDCDGRPIPKRPRRVRCAPVPPFEPERPGPRLMPTIQMPQATPPRLLKPTIVMPQPRQRALPTIEMPRAQVAGEMPAPPSQDDDDGMRAYLDDIVQGAVARAVAAVRKALPAQAETPGAPVASAAPPTPAAKHDARRKEARSARARALQSLRDEQEHSSIEKAMSDAKGNRTDAARILGISRHGLWKKLRRMGI